MLIHGFSGLGGEELDGKYCFKGGTFLNLRYFQRQYSAVKQFYAPGLHL